MKRLNSFILFSFSFLSLSFPFVLSASERVEWKLDDTYAGSHTDVVNDLRWKVPNMVRQTAIDLSVRMGMNYQDGWRYPLTIGFVDRTPRGAENALAYVQLFMGPNGIQQKLNINVEAYARENFNFDKVFAHELVHAMLNDAVGGEAALVFPVWLHEGLAVYGADQGETMVKAYHTRYFHMDRNLILNGLEGPHGGLDYAEDYLAIKYLVDEFGQNRFHQFIRVLIEEKGDVKKALYDIYYLDWETFQHNVHEYGLDTFHLLGPPKRGDNTKPY